MILDRVERKYWKLVQFENELIGAIANDGLLYMFAEEDISEVLNAVHPHNKRVWWFNESHDRECAERRGARVLVNPTVVDHLLGLPVVW